MGSHISIDNCVPSQARENKVYDKGEVEVEGYIAKSN
jgi:hypothetical protein